MKLLIVLLIWLAGCVPIPALEGYATYYTVASCKREGTSGTLTASGAPYNESEMTCALPFHPKKWGSKYRVTNLRTGKSIVCEHWDFGPGKHSRRVNAVIIDLSPAAMFALAGREGLRQGKIKVTVEKIKA
jgi:rare lipoprotein A (peptidoglycan hydrolase)